MPGVAVVSRASAGQPVGAVPALETAGLLVGGMCGFDYIDGQTESTLAIPVRPRDWPSRLEDSLFYFQTRARFWFVSDASESQQELSSVRGATRRGFAGAAAVQERTIAALSERPGCFNNLGRIFSQTLPRDERRSDSKTVTTPR